MWLIFRSSLLSCLPFLSFFGLLCPLVKLLWAVLTVAVLTRLLPLSDLFFCMFMALRAGSYPVPLSAFPPGLSPLAVFSLAAAVVHIGDSPDSVRYITLLPPTASVPGWTCLDDKLAVPGASGWHLQRDATLLLYTASGSGPAASLAPHTDPSVQLLVQPVDSSPLQLVSANIISWFSGRNLALWEAEVCLLLE